MRYLINSPMVIADNVDGEFVILNMESGKYYSAIETGAIAWELLSNAYSVEEASAIFSTHFLVPTEQVKKDLDLLLVEFVEGNLIKPCDATMPKTATPDLKNKTYKTPEVTTYTDMEGLLLVDPIHEVENMGWPNVKEDANQKK